MEMSMQYSPKQGMKSVSRRHAGCGFYNKNTKPRKSYIASSALVLVGAENQCIKQGIKEGWLRPNVKVTGVENDPKLWDGILKDAEENNIDMSLYTGNFEDYEPEENQKFNLIVADLMCTPMEWVGTKLSTLYPHLTKRGSAIAVNINIQYTINGAYKNFLHQEYISNQEYYDRLMYANVSVGRLDLIEPAAPITGVADDRFLYALYAFVSIQMHMKNHIGLKYRGCLKYSESTATQYMLTMRWETKA